MISKTVVLGVVCAFVSVGPRAFGADEKPGTIELAAPVTADFQRYVDLLAFPGYLALALENIGASPSLSQRLVVLDGTSLELGSFSFRYVGKNGDVYEYEAGLKPFGGDAAAVRLPVRADISDLKQGKVAVSVALPMSALIPRSLLDKVNLKLKSMLAPSVQRSLLDYLDTLAKKKAATGIDRSLSEGILIDAFNRRDPFSTPGRDAGEPGEAVDQWALITTLGMWLALIPAVMVAAKRRKRRLGAATANVGKRATPDQRTD
jgi:hypothetical protein